MKRGKLLTGIFAIFFCLIAAAQDKKPASLGGYVKDARTKLPLVEAVVTISSNAFDGQKFALTDSTGLYHITNLPPGTYLVAFEMEGYEKFVQPGIALKEGMSLGVSFEMIKERQKQKSDTSYPAPVTGNWHPVSDFF